MNISSVNEFCTMAGLRSCLTQKSEGSVAQHGADELQTSANAECSWTVHRKLDDDADRDMQERRLCRGIVGSLQYLSVDRCDVQFETNACAKEMKQPTKASWTLER